MNILTFDIEEWYVYKLYAKGEQDYYIPIIDYCLEILLDFLDERNIKATFFCLGVIATSHPHIVKQIASRGHEIGCHSNRHNFIYSMTPKQFRQDTYEALDSLQNLLGEKIDKYRAPAFSINDDNIWALEILVENGIKYDCSIFPGKKQPGGKKALERNSPYIFSTASGDIYEFPLSYSELLMKRIIFSGGGYFRLLPYTLIRSLTEKQKYNMTYFHIRDFDSRQKRVISPRYFQSYYGINGAYNKFRRYAKDFDFISLGAASEMIKWDEAGLDF